MWIWCIVANIVGLVVGSVIVTIFWCSRTTSGTFNVDTSDPDEHVLKITLDYPDEIPRAKRLILRSSSSQK